MNFSRVSFDDEPLILVNENDEEIGYLPKLECHLGQGILHRAFSIFIFDGNMRLLLQKRSAEKMLWPLFWSNSCCSHPRKGETYEIAIHRRLMEELGFDTPLKFLFRFRYQASYADKGSEHELCSVYVGRFDHEPVVHPDEIADWRYVSPQDLDQEIRENPDQFTPWFKMEWYRMRSEFWKDIQEFITGK